MLTLRTATMLVAMIVVPAIAMFGMSWKPLVDSSKPKSPGVGIAKSRPLGPAGPASWDANSAERAKVATPADEVSIKLGGVRPLEEISPEPALATALEVTPASVSSERDMSHQAAAQVPGLDPAWFRATIDRLRAVGATNYQLERWGTQGELYRFQCDVGDSSAQFARHFEATDTDATGAMQNVVAQIEAWCVAGRH